MVDSHSEFRANELLDEQAFARNPKVNYAQLKTERLINLRRANQRMREIFGDALDG